MFFYFWSLSEHIGFNVQNKGNTYSITTDENKIIELPNQVEDVTAIGYYVGSIRESKRFKASDNFSEIFLRGRNRKDNRQTDKRCKPA